MSGLAKIGQALFKMLSFVLFFELLKEIDIAFNSFDEKDEDEDGK